MPRFMRGRIGTDELGVVLAGVGVACQVASNATGWRAASWVAVGLWIFVLLRALTPAAAVSGEAAGEAGPSGFERSRRTIGRIWAERKEKRHFRCRSCGTILSVPRGVGKVRVTCPKCHHVTERRA